MTGGEEAAAVAALRIDYIEFAVADTARSKAFYGQAFGWHFIDFGPGYAEFTDGRMKGGFNALEDGPKPGGPLVVLHAGDLDAAQRRIEEAGGRIVKPAYGFPGGRRFHFTDPDGHELAVWTEDGSGC